MRIDVGKYFGLNALVLILFIVDRLLKIWFIKNPSIKIGGYFISGLLSFHLEKNIGIAFGIPVNQIVLFILIVIILLILVAIAIKTYQKKDPLSVLALSLIITGAVSNLIDRLHYRFVIDYIDVPWFTVFNLADCMITVGVGILLIGVLRNKRLDKE